MSDYIPNHSVEQFQVPDIYADGVSHVDVMANGLLIRTHFFIWDMSQRITVARIVRPKIGIEQGSLTRMIREALEHSRGEGH